MGVQGGEQEEGIGGDSRGDSRGDVGGSRVIRFPMINLDNGRVIKLG